MPAIKSSPKRQADSYAGIQFICLIAGLSLFLLLVVPLIVEALDLNGDNLPDDWESSYGITTNAYASSNLVGWWQMEPNSTNVVWDNSTNHLNGSLTNFPTNPFVTGLFSNALSFPTDGQVNFPSNNVFNTTTNQFTYSAWFQSTNNVTQAATLVTWKDAATNGWSVGVTTNGAANITFFDGTTAQVVVGTNSPVNLYDGSWHQVAATYATNHVSTVYVDGAGEGTNTITSWTPGVVSSFSMGISNSSATNNPFLLDEVRLYNRALGPTEVPQLPATYSDLNGSGLSTFEDYVEGLNPLATNSIVTSGFLSSGLTGYYSGSPSLTKTSGDGQTVAASTFATNPLVVQVKNGSGTPLVGAPVTFSIPSGSDGGVSLTSSGTTTTSLSMTTDGSGYATVYYESGPDALQNNTITATAVSGAGNVSVSFTAHCGVSSGLALWLKADAGVTLSGTNVSEWDDQTGTYAMTQGTGWQQPTYVANDMNGLPALRLNGSQFLYNSANMGLNADMTIITVAMTSNPGVVEESFCAGDYNTGANRGLGYVSSLQFFEGFNDGVVGAGTPPANTFVEEAATLDSSRSNVVFYRNGSETGATTIGSVQNMGSGMTIGCRSADHVCYWQGDIAEVLVYDHLLSSTEMNEVGSYLGDKYGLYNPNATWPLAYSSDVQALITANQWSKSQADAYVAFAATSPPVPASSLCLWLKADAGVTSSSGNVSAWADQSPAGNNAIQSSSGNQPQIISSAINGEPVIRFNGSSDYFQLGPGFQFLSSGMTAFAVFTPTSGSNNARIFNLGNGENTDNVLFLHYYSQATMQLDDVIGTSTFEEVHGGTELVLNSPQEYTVGKDGSTSLSLYRNGTLVGQTTSGVTAYNDVLRNSNFIGKSDWPGDSLYQGDIAEVLIYNRPLNSTEQQDVEVYLADKYGMYHPDATWPSAYSSDVQALITSNQWNKSQADAYVAFLATSPPVPAAGLCLWLKADAGVTSSSGNVSAWADQSPAGNNAVQSSSGSQPQIISSAINGEPVMRFNGSSDYFQLGPGFQYMSSGITAFTVFTPTSASNNARIFDLGNGENSDNILLLHYYSQATMQLYDVIGSSVYEAVNGGTELALNSPQEYTAGQDGSSSMSLYRNGTLVGQVTSGVTAYNDVLRNFNYIGKSDWPADAIYQGDIAEVLIYNRPLTSTEQQDVEVYLADKYGLYHPDATWPSAYSSDVQAEITAHQWNKAQADAYVTLQSDTSGVVTTGLMLWLKADVGVTQSSGNVSSWTDQSGNFTVTQATSGDQPTYVSSGINGKPALRFNGSQWLYNSKNMALNADMTIVTVGATTDATAHQYACCLGNDSVVGSNRALGYIGSQQLADTFYISSYGNSIAANAFTADMVTLDSGLTNVAFYQNGTLSGTGTLSGVQNLAPGVAIGYQSDDGGCGWEGDIAEVLVYDHKLTSTEIQQVSVYLANKYGLPYDGYDAPTISPAGGSYSGSQSVTISGPASPAVIKYTLDGSTPTLNSATYTGSFTLTGSALVQATVFFNGAIASPMASEQFTFGGSNLPTVPTSLGETVVSGHEIDLAWTLSGQVNYSGVNVYRSSDGGTTYQLIDSLDPTATSYQDFSVQSGSSYKYFVGTLNSAGESDTSASSSVTASTSGTMTISVSAPSGATSLP
jgi:hypothetical protein